MLQPDGRGDQLEDPDCEDDVQLFNAFQAAKPGEALPIEQRRADQRLHQVIGQSHLPHSRQAIPETGPGPSLV